MKEEKEDGEEEEEEEPSHPPLLQMTISYLNRFPRYPLPLELDLLYRTYMKEREKILHHIIETHRSKSQFFRKVKLFVQGELGGKGYSDFVLGIFSLRLYRLLSQISTSGAAPSFSSMNTLDARSFSHYELSPEQKEKLEEIKTHLKEDFEQLSSNPANKNLSIFNRIKKIVEARTEGRDFPNEALGAIAHRLYNDCRYLVKETPQTFTEMTLEDLERTCREEVLPEELAARVEEFRENLEQRIKEIERSIKEGAKFEKLKKYVLKELGGQNYSPQTLGAFALRLYHFWHRASKKEIKLVEVPPFLEMSQRFAINNGKELTPELEELANFIRNSKEEIHALFSSDPSYQGLPLFDQMKRYIWGLVPQGQFSDLELGSVAWRVTLSFQRVFRKKPLVLSPPPSSVPTSSSFSAPPASVEKEGTKRDERNQQQRETEEQQENQMETSNGKEGGEEGKGEGRDEKGDEKEKGRSSQPLWDPLSTLDPSEPAARHSDDN